MRKLALATIASGSVIAAACASAVPPYGEALFIVDTDLPVPTVINRLRVDSYAADGSWFSSADFSLPVGSSWPASFGVEASHTGAARDVLVRLRAYSNLSVRRYEGERYQPPANQPQVFVPETMTELCGQSPTLPIGGTVTVRRGRKAFGAKLTGGECSTVALGNAVGLAGAYVEIATAGSYCFSALATNPADEQVTLQLRKSCEDDTSGVACDDGITDRTNFTYGSPVVTATLQPGRYFLVETSGDYDMAPTDVVLAGVLGACDTLPTAPAVPSDAEAPAGYPLLFHGDPALTPAEEPEPSMTVDRLVRVSLQSGVVGAVRVTLKGECAGTMSKLGEHGVDFAAATTCIDAQHLAAPVAAIVVTPDTTLPTTSLQGTFAPPEPCPSSAVSTPALCIPGGTFVLGSLAGDSSSVPPRIAAVGTFWLDSNEVTIAQLRAAMARGFAFEKPDDIQTAAEVGVPYCEWTPTPGAVEGDAVTCISWYGARAFCQFAGGDLPTEAQWEYAATGGASFKTPFPWGYDAPVCACAAGQPACHAPVFGRQATFIASAQGISDCSGAGPRPVSANEGPTADSSIFGVVGLSGGVSEWALDSSHSYSSSCWRGAGVVNPVCWEPEALERSVRGGAWDLPVEQVLPVVRSPGLPGYAVLAVSVGFRCAYAKAPQ